MADEAQAPEGGAPSSSDGSQKAILFMIIIAVLVIILTPVITIFTFKSMQPKPVDEAIQKNKAAGIKTFTTSLEDISVNIKETDGSRYIIIKPVIDYDNEKIGDLFKERSPENPNGMLSKIRAEIMSIISEKDIKTLLSKHGKEEISREIKEKLNTMFKDKVEAGMITDVYFPKYLAQ